MPFTRSTAPILFLALVLGTASQAAASDLEVPAVLGDHMVLQRDTRVPLWGRGVPGKTVSIDASWGTWARTTVEADGRWETLLSTPSAGGPHRVVLRHEGEKRVFDDVLIGEVWLCGGQSNMEWTLGPVVGGGIDDWQELVADGDRNELRVFDVRHRTSSTPRFETQGRWVPSTAEAAPGFSAVAWLFARELQEDLGCPVGIITSKWGGTRAEAWTSAEGLADMPEMAAGLEQVAGWEGDRDAKVDAFAEAYQDWWRQLDARDPGLSEQWFAEDLVDVDWARVPATFRFQDHGLAQHDGTVWLRRRLFVPERWRGEPLRLDLGAIDDMDQVWVDGVPLASTLDPGAWQSPRRYDIDPLRSNAAELSITVRIIDTGGGGGLIGGSADAALLRLSTGERRAMVLPWRMRMGTELLGNDLPAAEPTMSQHLPSVLNNGMLAPLAPYRVRGVIFYQGESNRMEPMLYRRLFPALIADWRRQFRQDLPFYFVQIAPYGYAEDPMFASELREAQALTLSVPGTGMVVTMDVGDPTNIHPTNKLPVAQRLALLARRHVYGESRLVADGPLPLDMEAEDGSLRVRFDHAEGGLTTRDGGAPSHLEIAGANGTWVEAVGRIDGEELIVQAAGVPEPKSVRYGWGRAVEPNLAGPTGLPVTPFRLPVK